jgi:hypothetical protein
MKQMKCPDPPSLTALESREAAGRLCHARRRRPGARLRCSRATETDAMQAKRADRTTKRRGAVNIARLPELLGHKE